mmetsp:Transcript_8923/g.32935  ORF Transcript_8923/g.32935 Transcript_8923/m.32935 type:complete len:95 (-) Transcript_8923:2599-2883(-)
MHSVHSTGILEPKQSAAPLLIYFYICDKIGKKCHGDTHRVMFFLINQISDASQRTLWNITLPITFDGECFDALPRIQKWMDQTTVFEKLFKTPW